MKGRILIVEDEPAIQLALSGLLRRDGYEIHTASSGSDAFKKVESEDLELVLTDLSLGDGITGMDVLRHVKEHQPGTAVVMITAYGSEHVARDAVAAGADGYVPKPFNNNEIRAEVARVIGSRAESTS